MHDVAVRIALADWREWLLSVADTRTLRRLELPAELLDARAADAIPLLEHLGLSVLHVPDAIPANLSRYASESGLAADDAALGTLTRDLRARLGGRVRCTSLDLGLDRLSTEGVEAGLRRREHLLRVLVEGLEGSGVALAVRVRLPRPFGGSHEWEWAGNLLHEIAEVHAGLALDVVLSDLAEDLDIEALLRECSAHLMLVRLHFRWRWGESPTAATWERWCNALRHHSGRLGVVFCPTALPLAAATVLLADVERWSAPLTAEYRRPGQGS
jgi:hypothetical protein